MPELSEQMVEFRDVRYVAGATVILDGLNLEVLPGEVLILLGESGCGKTTTLKMINRLIEPTTGDVFVEGRRTQDWDAIELRRRIGYVLQEAGLFPHFSVGENVELVPRLLDWDKGKRESRAAELLALVGLEPG